MNAQAIRAQAMKGVLWTFLQKWGGRVASLLTFVVLARLLDPKDFGIVALAAVFVGITSAFADGGFASYLVQARDLDQRTTSTAFWSVLAMSLCLTGVLVVSAPLWALALSSPELVPVLQVLSVGVLLSGLSSTQVALLKRRLAFKVLALRSLVATFVSCAVAVVFALAGAGVWSLVAQSLVLAATSAVILWSSARWVPSLSFSWRIGHEIARYGSKVAVSQTVLSLKSRGDDLIIAAVLGPVALGYWTIATRILHLLVDTFVSVISVVATPVFARLKDDSRRLQGAYVRAVSASLALMAPVLISVAIVSPTLVPLLFGSKWTVSGELAQVVTLAGLTTALTYYDRGMMLALGRAGTELRLALITTVVGLAMVAAAAPFGLTAVAVAAVARGVVAWPVRLSVTAPALGLSVPALVKRIGLITAAVIAGASSALLGNWLLGSRVPDAVQVLIVPLVTLSVTIPVLRTLVPDLWTDLRATLTRASLRKRRKNSAPAGIAPPPPGGASSVAMR